MHVTTLIEIDPATGAGASIGELPFDVWIVGMACAPDGTLYGATAPFGANPFFAVPRLYSGSMKFRQDRSTRSMGCVGPAPSPMLFSSLRGRGELMQCGLHRACSGPKRRFNVPGGCR